MSVPRGSVPLPTAAAEDGERQDLRTGSRRDLGVEVERDLTAAGRLARGGSTRFSTLRFRSVGSPARAEPPAPVAAEPAAAPPAERAERPSLGQRILRMLGLG